MIDPEKLEKGQRVWTKLDYGFYQSAKIKEVKDKYVIVGYNTFNDTTKKYQKSFSDIYLRKENLPE